MSQGLRHEVERGLYVRESCPTHAARPQRVLWIHGLGESGLCFERLVTEPGLLEATHLVPDLPGYGRSAPLETAESLEDSVGRLAALLDARGWSETVVVGHSMGGVIGILLAERHPELVSRYVNVEGNLSRGDCIFSGQAAGLPLETFVESGFDAMRERIFASGRDDLSLRGYYASLRFADAAQFHRHAEELVALSAEETLAMRHAALRCPTLYVAGVPRGVSDRSLSLMEGTGAALSRIDGSGHWPFLDRPGEFVDLAASFLNATG